MRYRTHRHPTRTLTRRLARGQGGFTLIELLVGMILLSILVTAFAELVGSTMKHSAQITGESALEAEVRGAVTEIVTDLRQAYPPSAAATSVFVGATISPTTLTFYSPDRTYSTGSPTAFHLREITYQLSGGAFQRAVAPSSNTDGPPWTIGAFGSWITRVSGVTNTDVFTAYDGNDPPVATTDPTKVATIVVKLTVSAPGEPGNTFTYSDSATIRVG